MVNEQLTELQAEIAKNISDTNKKLYKSFSYRPMSVSKCLVYIAPEFNQEAKAAELSARDFDNPDATYYHMTPEDIIALWTNKSETSMHYGSLLDDYVGLRVNNKDYEIDEWKMKHGYDYDDRLKSLCTGFDQFYNAILTRTDYRYVVREMSLYIFSKKSGKAINGRFDCLFYSPSQNKYMLVDWKTTEKIPSSNPYKNDSKMYGPCFKLDNCKHNTYTMQTHLYKKTFCETYELCTYDNINCYICQFLTEPLENGNYYKLYIENFPYNSPMLDDVIDWGYKINEKRNGK